MRYMVTPRPFQAWRSYNHVGRSLRAPRFITASARAPHARPIGTIRSVDNTIDEAAFYDQAYIVQEPLVIRDYVKLPVSTWFHQNEHGDFTLDSKLTQDPNTPEMPYEYVRTNTDDDVALTNFTEWLRGDKASSSPPDPRSADNQTRFSQFTAPIGLLSKAMEFNAQQGNSRMRYKRLYIAQMPINELSSELQLDLEAPKLLQCSDRPCDVYNTSIWLGLEPIYTPFHRDPNPNFFMQVVGQKTLRLLPPGQGGQVFTQVQNAIGSASNSKIRGAEMMEGPERGALHDAVWGSDAPQEVVETTLGPRDCLFIPKGWWHSVKSLVAYSDTDFLITKDDTIETLNEHAGNNNVVVDTGGLAHFSLRDKNPPPAGFGAATLQDPDVQKAMLNLSSSELRKRHDRVTEEPVYFSVPDKRLAEAHFNSKLDRSGPEMAQKSRFADGQSSDWDCRPVGHRTRSKCQPYDNLA
ncbi:JmjC domain-containing protein [Apiospora marii]|uniref:JmjC domain-containing protein n=1 Tax=Apiospora marii TaxID=335849 RepID=A0ABR1R629_9PEZI